MLLTATIWFLPSGDGIFLSLSAEEEPLTISGLVKAAPYNTPVQRALVYSDRALVLTDDNGYFRIASGKNAVLRIEAPGHVSTAVRIEDTTPLMLLLFPKSPKN